MLREIRQCGGGHVVLRTARITPGDEGELGTTIRLADREGLGLAGQGHGLQRRRTASCRVQSVRDGLAQGGAGFGNRHFGLSLCRLGIWHRCRAAAQAAQVVVEQFGFEHRRSQINRQNHRLLLKAFR